MSAIAPAGGAGGIENAGGILVVVEDVDKDKEEPRRDSAAEESPGAAGATARRKGSGVTVSTRFVSAGDFP